MRNRSLRDAALKVVCLAVGVAAGMPMALGNSIAGTLNIGGTITITNLNAGTISFAPLANGSAFTFVVLPSTGSFSSLQTYGGAETTSLNGTAEPINTVLASPIIGFLSIPAAPLTFDLTQVLGAATADGTACTSSTTTGSCYIAGTPFNLNTGSGGTSMTFSVMGNLNYGGLTANGAILQYSATFVNQSIADVLNAFLTTGTSLQSSDAQVTVNVTGPIIPVSAGIYVTDGQNNRIRKVNAAGTINTFAGNGGGGYGGDGGAATSAQLHSPYGIGLDSTGDLYIADFQNNRIRMVNPSGTITTVAGIGLAGFAGMGGSALTAWLDNPRGVAADSSGNLFIADTHEHRILKVTAGVITVVAGNGSAGSGGDGGPATSAQLYHPAGIAVDSYGNMYIADSDNQRIRKVNASGTITTIAGNGSVGYNCNNGVAKSVGLHNPTSVAVDGSGNLYIADYGNHCVRMVNSAGAITAVAGNGTSTYGGDGGPAIQAGVSSPSGVAVDASGSLYIADYVSNRVRKVTSGIITTVVGNGSAGFSGDGGAGVSAQLYNPNSVTVAPGPSPLVGP